MEKNKSNFIRGILMFLAWSLVTAIVLLGITFLVFFII